MTMKVYADNAATTALNQKAAQAMSDYMFNEFGNPSGHHSISRSAHKMLKDCRERMASMIGAEPSEIYFTGGGSESDNLAIKGVMEARKKNGKHMITSSIEHHAVLYTCEYQEKQGFEVTYLPVDEFGRVSLDDVRSSIRQDTVLISIMAANNEVGTLQPITEIGALAKEHGILFHTDAVQVMGHLPVNVKKMNIDLLAMAAHKFGGPKGVGALYVRNGIRVIPLIHGGGQERGLRGGTENVTGILGMTVALEEAVKNQDIEIRRVSAMRDRLINGLLKLPKTRLTGHPTERLPGIASFVFEGIEGESAILLLDQLGICASTASACSSKSLEPSHVLLSMGLPHEIAHGSMRFSLGHNNSEQDVDYLLQNVPPVVARLRAMSPLWEE